MKKSDSVLSAARAFALAAIFGLLSASCDIITDPTKDLVPVDTTGGTEQVVRKVFLEEYTGHRCGNCPEGTEKAEQLKTIYGNRLIVMSIHAGTFATAVAGAPMYYYEFRTPTGTAMNQQYNVEAAGYPSATINRAGSRVWGMNQWPSIIDTMLQRPTAAKITVTPTVDTVSRQLQLAVQTKFLKAEGNAQNLSVYLVETDLVNWQKDYRLANPDISNYKHKYFLRANLTSTWGNVLTYGAVPNGHTVTKNFTYTIPANFNLSKCRIIAVVNHPTNYLVMQAEESGYLK